MAEPLKVPLSPAGTSGKAQQGQQQPKHALKFNLQMNPTNISNSNGFKGKKILKRDFSSASMPRDYSDAFLPKKIEVEKNFLRINYLKDKEQEAAEAVAQAFTVINQSSKSSVKLSPRRQLQNAASDKNIVNKHFKQQQQQQNQKQQHNHQKQLLLNQIDQNDHSQGEQHKRKSSILHGQMKLAAEMTSFPVRKSQDKLKILQIQTNQELNNQHQQEQIIQQSSQDPIDPSILSSPVEQTDKILNQPSKQQKQQLDQKKSSKTPEKRPSGSSGNSRRTPNNDNQSMKSLRIQKDNSINFSNKSLNSPISSVRYQAVNGCVSDLSVEWNNKGSILSSSGCNKTAEILQKKFQTIFQRKQEKSQIRQLQSAEKALRDELYGLFSQQSRQLKIKKQQEMQLLENLQKNVFSIPDTVQIQRVNDLVRSSYEAFKAKKVQEAEEAIRAEEEEKKRRADILLKYGTEVRQINSDRQRELDAERELKGESQLNNIPHSWGVDQRKFETKSADKKPEKMIRKQKIPLKELFTLNVSANEAVKEKMTAMQEQQNSQKVIRESKIIQRKPMTAEERAQMAQVRCQRVMEEIQQTEKQDIQKKEEIKGKLQNLEQNRLKSIENTKKKPFKPTEEMINNAFIIIENDENQQNSNENINNNNNNNNGYFDQTFGQQKQNKQILVSEKQQQQLGNKVIEGSKVEKKEEESRESSGKIVNNNRENHRKQDRNYNQGKEKQLSQKKREESIRKSSSSSNVVAKGSKNRLP